jgi:hypothetical protein
MPKSSSSSNENILQNKVRPEHKKLQAWTELDRLYYSYIFKIKCKSCSLNENLEFRMNFESNIVN